MNSPAKFTGKFSFLNAIADEGYHQYQSATWLLSGFEESVWNCQFEKLKITLDFRIQLEDGSLLTAGKNEILLRTLKSWLCVQTHPSMNGSRPSAPITDYHKVLRALYCCDYLLFRSKRFSLAKFGLTTLTSDDIKNMLWDLASSPTIANSVYQWERTVSDYLKKSITKLTDREIKDCIAQCPEIETIDPQVERGLQLEDKELVHARVYLWTRGFYNKFATRSEYRHTVNNRLLAKELYANTLWGQKSRPNHEELSFHRQSVYVREFERVPVKSWGEDSITDRTLLSYLPTIRSLGMLTSIQLPIPLTALEATTDRSFLESLPTCGTGRFRTLPYNVVSKSLRNAIEFALKYGDELVTSYVNLAIACKSAGITSLHYFNSRFDVSKFMTPKIKELGVRHWSLHNQFIAVENGNTSKAPDARPLPSKFFSRFRANEGLFELLEVLYGAIQACVGTLMARRQGELDDLDAATALDVSESYMIFRNRKTGAIGRRKQIARPIPYIGAELIKIITRLQDQLIELGFIDGYGKLFATPNGANLGLTKNVRPDRYFDRFCDYFELDRNKLDQRYYLRQHQLRRNFAMVFFWGASFGGLETLQWFLGHADPEHIYHYITESMPGSVLTSIKAGYAADLLRTESKEVTALRDLVERHFGTRNFSVLEYEELQNYVEELILDNAVTVKPYFFKVGHRKQYRILISVKESQ